MLKYTHFLRDGKIMRSSPGQGAIIVLVFVTVEFDNSC